MSKMKLLLTLAIPALLAQGVQAQSNSRLIAEAHWLHNGAEFKRNDSTAYNFTSTARGGDLDHLMKFDDATQWVYLADTATNSMRYLQEFDASNNLTNKISQVWDGVVTFNWVNQTQNLYTYNTSNKKATMITRHWDGTSAWVTDSKNVYSYNAAGQMYIDQFQLWDGTAYNANNQKTYYYDAAGNVINMTAVDLSMGSPLFTTKTDYSFDAHNNELTETNSTWNGAAWDTTNMHTETYDTSNNELTDLYQTYTIGTGLVNNMLSIFSNFTSGHKAQTQIDQTWDAVTSTWVNQKQYTMTYNAKNQLTSSTAQSYDISVGWAYAAGDAKARYYYGTYASAVKNVSSVNGSATVYPVPAYNSVNIDLKWNKAQAATIIISDMQGKVVSETAVPSATEYHTGFSVNSFADGVYFVRINGTDGQIVKQIVVAH